MTIDAKNIEPFEYKIADLLSVWLTETLELDFHQSAIEVMNSRVYFLKNKFWKNFVSINLKKISVTIFLNFFQKISKKLKFQKF